MDKSDTPPTAALRPCNNHHQSRHTTPTIENLVSSQSPEKAVRIIPGHAGIVQMANIRKIAYIMKGGQECVMPTQECIRKVVEYVGEDEDFTRSPWVSAVEFVNANGGNVSRCLGDIKNFRKNGKLEQVVAIYKSCTLNALGDLTLTLKDLSGINYGTIHHKVLTEGSYGKAITVGAALLLQHVFMFSPKQSGHYINITMRNVVKVFHKDTLIGNGCGVGGSGSVCGTIDLPESDGRLTKDGHLNEEQEHQLRLDQEVLTQTLEEDARAEQEWEDRIRQEREEEDMFLLEFGLESD